MGNLSTSDMLEVKDQLNLNLVMLREKPGMIINLNNYNERYEDFMLDNRLYEGFVEELEDILEISKEAGIFYKFAEPMVRGDYEIRRVAVATNAANIGHLLQEEFDWQKARALGIPAEDYMNSVGINAGAKRDDQLRLAFGFGVKIPSWLAYLDYAPVPFDLLNNRVSALSENLGLRYQAAILKHDTKLAKRVEDHFYNTFLPSLLD